MAVRIEIISDVVCPWCFIGKRRLEEALRRVDAQVDVLWRPFQLNPDLPDTGVAREEYIRRKFGSAGPGLYARVAAVGETVGIPFAFERIARQPNTLRAHQLIALAEPGRQQDAVVETLFRAYFLEGADLTSAQTLAGLAVLISLYALTAIGYRTWNDGFTPNRVTIIGWNVLNIALLTLLLARQSRSNGQTWRQAMYETFALGAKAYLGWAVIVLVGLPWLFMWASEPINFWDR